MPPISSFAQRHAAPRRFARCGLALVGPALLAVAGTAGAATVHYELSGQLQRQDSALVPASLESYLQSHFDGRSVTIGITLDLATPDVLPAAGSAHYQGAVIGSSIVIDGIAMPMIDFCSDTLTLDCSIQVDNDLPAFGGQMDSYLLRSRNFALEPGAPNVPDVIPLLSFLFSTGAFTTGGGSPTLLTSTDMDPGLAALIAGRPEGFSLNLQGIADCGIAPCYDASWTLAGLNVREVPADDPAGVPEPGTLPVVLAALAALAWARRLQASGDGALSGPAGA